MTTKKTPALIYGASGHAKVVIDIVERAGAAEIAFLVDDDPRLRGARFFGYPVLGGLAELQTWLAANAAPGAIVAIGDNTARSRIAGVLTRHGLTLTAAIHPMAAIGRNVDIGAGTVIMGGCVVNPDTVIGRNTIINTGATIDHDCSIGNDVHIAPGSHLCGGVKVGAGSFLGAGCIVIPGVQIGANATIGAGSTVIADVADGARLAGSPARPLARAS
jgi:sugar O-acyltransferase (sialic acid O-acetyltransferase NeuD family)